MPTPSNNPGTSTGGREVQEPRLFAELTERQAMPQTIATIAGLAKSQRLLIEKVGVVSKIRLTVKCSFTTKSGKKPILNYGAPWKFLKEIALQANGVTGVIQCGGVVLQMRRNRVFRNPKSAIFSGEEYTGNKLTESKKYEWTFVVEIPIAHDMETIIGSLLAQNEETQLSVEITWASEEEIINETGAIEKFEGEVEWTTTVFSIGSTVVGKNEVTVLPDLSAFHGLIQTETPLTGTGNRKAELVRTSGQLLCYTATILNGAGGKEQSEPKEWTRFVVEYGGNKDPLAWVPAGELLEENADDYNGPLKVSGMWFLALDNERDNSARDMIIPDQVVELRAVIGVPAAFSASNAQIFTTQETLYPAV